MVLSWLNKLTSIGEIEQKQYRMKALEHVAGTAILAGTDTVNNPSLLYL
jgi:hypothetical protein